MLPLFRPAAKFEWTVGVELLVLTPEFEMTTGVPFEPVVVLSAKYGRTSNSEYWRAGFKFIVLVC